MAFLDHADWGAANMGVTLDAAGKLVGSKHFVADAGVAESFVVVASEAGMPVLALVERTAIGDGAISDNVLIDLTKRAANVDFTGVMPAQVLRGEAVALRSGTRCCWVRC